MAAWEWIALGLGLLVLVQLVALQYARRLGSDEGEAAPQVTPGNGAETSRSGTHEPMAGTDQVLCTSCGTQNEPGFTFCRECVRPLA